MGEMWNNSGSSGEQKELNVPFALRARARGVSIVASASDKRLSATKGGWVNYGPLAGVMAADHRLLTAGGNHKFRVCA